MMSVITASQPPLCTKKIQMNNVAPNEQCCTKIQMNNVIKIQVNKADDPAQFKPKETKKQAKNN